MLAAAQRIYDRLAAVGFGTTDLQTYLGGIGDILFQEIEDLASDGPLGQAGWSSLLDLNRVPNKALPWLGQFIGVQLPAGLTPADQRVRIQNTDGWKRGTPAAIAAAPLPYLGGTKTVILRERDPAAAPNDPAYGLTVITKRNETPFGLKTAAAPLTVSGNEITDAVRAAGVQGDGRQNDLSFGVYEATTNRCINSHGKTNITGWQSGFGYTSTLTRQIDATYGTCFALTIDAIGTGTSNLASIDMVGGSVVAGAKWAGRGAFRASGSLIGKTLRILWWESGGAFGPQIAGATTLGFKDIVLTGSWQEFTNSLGSIIRADRTALTYYIQILQLPSPGDVLYFTAIQGENLPVSTAWITTDGAIAARAAARVQASATLLDATQTWFAARIYPGWASGVNPFGATVKNPRVASWRTTYPDAIELYFDDASNTWVMNQGRTGGAQIVATHTIDGAVTLIGYQKNGEVGIRLNGSAWTKFVTPTVPLVTANLPASFELGSIAPGAGNLDGRMAWLACGTGVLTDADADALYALGDTEPTKDTLSPGAMLTAVFPFNTTSYLDLSGPDPKVLAALVEQKPAGIILNYQVLAGQDYSILLSGNPLYSNVFANFLTYQGVVNNVPGT